MPMCLSCKTDKPVSDFSLSNVGNPKYDCKECTRKKAKAERLLKLPTESKCITCGQTKLMEHMTSLTKCKDCRNEALRKARSNNTLTQSVENEPTKTCISCNLEKPQSDMLQNKNTCKACRNTKERAKIELLTEEEKRIRQEKERLRGKARYAANREKHAEVCKEIYQRNKEIRKQQHRKNTYGLSNDQYEKMITDQSNACGICNRVFDDTFPPFIDHNHSTGKVRELLCRSCNSAIGYANEDTNILRRMIEYLNRHSITEVTVPTV